MAKDPLLEIVETLTRGEKKGFSMLHGNAASQGKDWLKLFREMNNPRGFNSVKVIKKFKNEKAYYNARSTLKKELDLFLTNRESGPRKMIFNYSSLALEYLERHLFDHALDNIKKGKEIAEKYEALDELGVLLNLEQSIPGRLQYDSLRSEVEVFYQKRDQYEKIGILARRLEGGLKEVRNEELKISLADTILRDAEEIQRDGFGLDKLAFEFNVLLRKCYYLKSDFVIALAFSQKATDSLRAKTDLLDQSFLNKIINEYSIQASFHSHIGNEAGFKNAIAQIRFFPIQFPGLDCLKVSKLFLPLVAHCLATGQFNEAVSEAERFRSIMVQKNEQLIPKDLIRIYFFLSLLFFIEENVQQSVFFLNEFHSMRRFAPKTHRLFYPYAELIGIADLIKREINDVASTRLKSLKRHITQEESNYPYFQVVISTFSHLIEFGKYFDPRFLASQNNKLASLEDVKSSKVHFGYFDPGPFLLSILNRTALKEAYLSKIQENEPGNFDFGNTHNGI